MHVKILLRLGYYMDLKKLRHLRLGVIMTNSSIPSEHESRVNIQGIEICLGFSR